MTKIAITTKFDTFDSTLESPAGFGFEITPDSDTDLDNHTRAIYVGTGGTLKLILVGNTDSEIITLENVQSGSVLPLRARRVLEVTGTSSGSGSGSSDSEASNIIGLF